MMALFDNAAMILPDNTTRGHFNATCTSCNKETKYLFGSYFGNFECKHCGEKATPPAEFIGTLERKD